MDLKSRIGQKNCIPFLKWAGGKRWFIAKYKGIFPKSYNRYIEPFLGSGAVFFELNPNEAILSDTNKDLINTYLAIQKDWGKVETYLRKHHLKHNNEYYYKLRSQKTKNIFKNAAKIIYLNRTCWNGLYRVNMKGEFNVPIGTKKNVILDSDDFEKISQYLENAKILYLDFEKVVDMADKNDLLFADPPYTVRHDNNSFIKYNNLLFKWDDQVRLKEALVRARKRGVHVIATNAHHDSIYDLYKKDFNIRSLERNSVISGKSQYRGICQEFLIKG